MATSIDQKNYVKTALRLPPELHAAVHEAAQASGRSYNAQLVFFLEKAVAMPEGFVPAPISVRMFDDAGEFVSKNPKELMSTLVEKLTDAYRLASIFKQYEDGEPENTAIGDEPDWVSGKGPKSKSAQPTVKRVRRSSPKK